jgi:hypothetical protein
VHGAIHNEKGLDIKALRQHVAQGKLLAEFSEGAVGGGRAWASGPCTQPLGPESLTIFFCATNLDVSVAAAPAACHSPRPAAAGARAHPPHPPPQAVDKAEILQMPCDVLVPAAIGGVITGDNAHKISCKFLVAAANGPTTPEGDRVLRERGITVLPDIYANGGGVTVRWASIFTDWSFDREGWGRGPYLSLETVARNRGGGRGAGRG